MTQEIRSPPASYSAADEIVWDAPWVDVILSVELPYWLMIEQSQIKIEYEGHLFTISIDQEEFELQAGGFSQRAWAVATDLNNSVEEFVVSRNGEEIPWRKSKTVLRINSRCNADVITKSGPDEGRRDKRPAVRNISQIYLQTLCRAHIPLVNKVIASYRYLTYDYFVHEVSSWDVPIWHLNAGDLIVRCCLVPYRDWGDRPFTKSRNQSSVNKLSFLTAEQLQDNLNVFINSGEIELMDAFNLMERGDFANAVRKITTAIEVIVETCLLIEIEKASGIEEAEEFIRKTRLNFKSRLEKLCLLADIKLTAADHKLLKETRSLRHEIVHRGKRLSVNDYGSTQRLVDCSRWLFDRLERKADRKTVRDQNIASRAFGRNIFQGAFYAEFCPDGICIKSKF